MAASLRPAATITWGPGAASGGGKRLQVANLWMAPPEECLHKRARIYGGNMVECVVGRCRVVCLTRAEGEGHGELRTVKPTNV